jgi:hypothetical protein
LPLWRALRASCHLPDFVARIAAVLGLLGIWLGLVGLYLGVLPLIDHSSIFDRLGPFGFGGDLRFWLPRLPAATPRCPER